MRWGCCLGLPNLLFGDARLLFGTVRLLFGAVRLLVRAVWLLVGTVRLLFGAVRLAFAQVQERPGLIPTRLGASWLLATIPNISAGSWLPFPAD
eukprot:gene16506-biopygen5270